MDDGTKLQADHVVLIGTVARYPEPTHQHIATINRDRAGEDLDAILQAILSDLEVAS